MDPHGVWPCMCPSCYYIQVPLMITVKEGEVLYRATPHAENVQEATLDGSKQEVEELGKSTGSPWIAMDRQGKRPMSCNRNRPSRRKTRCILYNTLHSTTPLQYHTMKQKKIYISYHYITMSKYITYTLHPLHYTTLHYITLLNSPFVN